MTLTPVQQRTVREIVSLLMQRPITEAIALRVETFEGFSHLEIVDGQWIGFDEDEYMGGEEHGRIEFKLLLRLGTYVEETKSGTVYPGDTDFVLEGDPGDIRLKRRPDVAVVSNTRAKDERILLRRAGYRYRNHFAHRTERPGDIRRKLNDYLTHNVQQVWQVYPDTQEIIVYTPDGAAWTYAAGQTLPGGDLLPGFKLDVAAVFR